SLAFAVLLANSAYLAAFADPSLFSLRLFGKSGPAGLGTARAERERGAALPEDGWARLSARRAESGPSRTRTCDLLVRSRDSKDRPSPTDRDEDPNDQ